MRLAFAIVLLLGCDPETFDLVGLRDAAIDTGVEDTGVEDTGTPDTGNTDVGFPDMGFPDTGVEDTGTPDTGVECVCRLTARCLSDPDCAAIPGSTCDSNACTGSLGMCTSDTDCRAPGTWRCTLDESTLDPCL